MTGPGNSSFLSLRTAGGPGFNGVRKLCNEEQMEKNNILIFDSNGTYGKA